MHLAISRILATFDIAPSKHEKVEYRPSALSGLISCVFIHHLSFRLSESYHLPHEHRHPGPFKCEITPRSEEAANLIRQAHENMSHEYKV